ncbi:MAG: RnfABCDGE type electron transport complex subunit D [Ruminococcaceae bacterium]|nr:RnfABCDGE type electron transport complex subunit D [Oscillospiraceae bacterium]
MDNLLHLSPSPHIHSHRSTSSTMRDVLIALLPATVAAVVIFGWRSLLVVAVCVASCVLFEALFNLITKKEQTVGDLSAAVTGLLLALNLPANIPIWQCVVGCAFAILIVKCLFGGIGCNLVNPAITARVFMLVSFGSMAVAAAPVIVDTASGATPLLQFAQGSSPSLRDLFFGTTGGAMGETCALALLIGFAYLLIRRIITWHIPVMFVGSVFALSFLIEGFDAVRALGLILSGGLLIGAIFMATDYVTSPSTAWGKVIFGLGAGLITFLIRYFGVYPEGVSFAILFMNILTPYIEKLTARKIFGGIKA